MMQDITRALTETLMGWVGRPSYVVMLSPKICAEDRNPPTKAANYLIPRLVQMPCLSKLWLSKHHIYCVILFLKNKAWLPVLCGYFSLGLGLAYSAA